MCALETAALEITTNTDSGGPVSKEAIEKCIESLEDEGQKDFIRKCLIKDPSLRPKARDLLFHPVLFEVPTLKLLAAHTLVNDSPSTTENMTDEEKRERLRKLDSVRTFIRLRDVRACRITGSRIAVVADSSQLLLFKEPA